MPDSRPNESLITNAYLAMVLLPSIDLLFLIGLHICQIFAQEEDEAPVVQTEQGSVKGFRLTSIREKEFIAFLGIPYAKPPVDDLRFKAPQPPDPWKETFEATGECSICPQIDMMSGKSGGSENCLCLNLFTNKLPQNETDLRAVMVWIHGGAYLSGSGSTILYGPDHLLTEDIVLVTINYRLAVLGFLSLKEAGIPGNNGMKDQVMALRWVQKNIAKFGGDPNKVTIFGESAGGASVHLHMLSPMSVGLFHRAISESGTSLSSWTYAEPEYLNKAAFLIGAKIGCNETNAIELYKCLMKKPFKDFVNITAYEDLTGIQLVEFCPTREDGSVSGEEVFLYGKPEDLVSARKFYAVPFITGINNKESLTFLGVTKKPSFWDNFDKHFDEIVADTAGKDISMVKQYSARIKKFYFKDKKPSEETIDDFIDCFTDLSFLVGADRTVKKQCPFSTAPIFLYYFQFDGELGIVKRAVKVTKPGAAHGDEMGYLFNSAISESVEESSDEMKCLKRMVRMWTNFAKTGNPTPEVDPLLDVIWQPYTKWDPVYLDINKELTMKRDLLKERAEIWQQAMDPVW